MNNNLKNYIYNTIIRNIANIIKNAINEAYKREEKITYEITIPDDCKYIFIGDPCILSKDVYLDIWGPNFNNGVIGDNIGLVHSTYIGDGSYDSDSGTLYSVDAGSLGMFDIRYCNSKTIRKMLIDKNYHPGKLFKITGKNKSIKLIYRNGDFEFYLNLKKIETIYTGLKNNKE